MWSPDADVSNCKRERKHDEGDQRQTNQSKDSKFPAYAVHRAIILKYLGGREREGGGREKKKEKGEGGEREREERGRERRRREGREGGREGGREREEGREGREKEEGREGGRKGKREVVSGESSEGDEVYALTSPKEVSRQLRKMKLVSARYL